MKEKVQNKGVEYDKIKLLIIPPLSSGKVGERQVASILRALPKEQYVVMNNVMLNGMNGTTYRMIVI